MPIRRILVDLELAALADPDASGDVLLVITPDGVLKRQEIPPPMSTLTYGPGTYDLVVPPGVTSLQVEAQAPGGGAAGALADAALDELEAAADAALDGRTRRLGRLR